MNGYNILGQIKLIYVNGKGSYVAKNLYKLEFLNIQSAFFKYDYFLKLQSKNDFIKSARY